MSAKDVSAPDQFTNAYGKRISIINMKGAMILRDRVIESPENMNIRIRENGSWNFLTNERYEFLKLLKSGEYDPKHIKLCKFCSSKGEKSTMRLILLNQFTKCVKTECRK